MIDAIIEIIKELLDENFATAPQVFTQRWGITFLGTEYMQETCYLTHQMNHRSGKTAAVLAIEGDKILIDTICSKLTCCKYARVVWYTICLADPDSLDVIINILRTSFEMENKKRERKRAKRLRKCHSQRR